MGYTHYWRHRISSDDARLPEACRDMGRAIELSRGKLAGPTGDDAPEVESHRVSFNGIGDNGCETFDFPGTPGFDFCKTRARPYDTTVMACLAIAKDIFGDDIEVSSDGDATEWADGVRLAVKATSRDVANPITESD